MSKNQFNLFSLKLYLWRRKRRLRLRLFKTKFRFTNVTNIRLHFLSLVQSPKLQTYFRCLNHPRFSNFKHLPLNIIENYWYLYVKHFFKSKNKVLLISKISKYVRQYILAKNSMDRGNLRGIPNIDIDYEINFAKSLGLSHRIKISVRRHLFFRTQILRHFRLYALLKKTDPQLFINDRDLFFDVLMLSLRKHFFNKYKNTPFFKKRKNTKSNLSLVPIETNTSNLINYSDNAILEKYLTTLNTITPNSLKLSDNLISESGKRSGLFTIYHKLNGYPQLRQADFVSDYSNLNDAGFEEFYNSQLEEFEEELPAFDRFDIFIPFDDVGSLVNSRSWESHTLETLHWLFSDYINNTLPYYFNTINSEYMYTHRLRNDKRAHTPWQIALEEDFEEDDFTPEYDDFTTFGILRKQPTIDSIFIHFTKKKSTQFTKKIKFDKPKFSIKNKPTGSQISIIFYKNQYKKLLHITTLDFSNQTLLKPLEPLYNHLYNKFILNILFPIYNNKIDPTFKFIREKSNQTSSTINHFSTNTYQKIQPTILENYNYFFNKIKKFIPLNKYMDHKLKQNFKEWSADKLFLSDLLQEDTPYFFQPRNSNPKKFQKRLNIAHKLLFNPEKNQHKNIPLSYILNKFYNLETHKTNSLDTNTIFNKNSSYNLETILDPGFNIKYLDFVAEFGDKRETRDPNYFFNPDDLEMTEESKLDAQECNYGYNNRGDLEDELNNIFDNEGLVEFDPYTHDNPFTGDYFENANKYFNTIVNPLTDTDELTTLNRETDIYTGRVNTLTKDQFFFHNPTKNTENYVRLVELSQTERINLFNETKMIWDALPPEEKEHADYIADLREILDANSDDQRDLTIEEISSMHGLVNKNMNLIRFDFLFDVEREQEKDQLELGLSNDLFEVEPENPNPDISPPFYILPPTITNTTFKDLHESLKFKHLTYRAFDYKYYVSLDNLARTNMPYIDLSLEPTKTKKLKSKSLLGRLFQIFKDLIKNYDSSLTEKSFKIYKIDQNYENFKKALSNQKNIQLINKPPIWQILKKNLIYLNSLKTPSPINNIFQKYYINLKKNTPTISYKILNETAPINVFFEKTNFYTNITTLLNQQHKKIANILKKKINKKDKIQLTHKPIFQYNWPCELEYLIHFHHNQINNPVDQLIFCTNTTNQVLKKPNLGLSLRIFNNKKTMAIELTFDEQHVFDLQKIYYVNNIIKTLSSLFYSKEHLYQYKNPAPITNSELSAISIPTENYAENISINNYDANTIFQTIFETHFIFKPHTLSKKINNPISLYLQNKNPEKVKPLFFFKNKYKIKGEIFTNKSNITNPDHDITNFFRDLENLLKNEPISNLPTPILSHSDKYIKYQPIDSTNIIKIIPLSLNNKFPPDKFTTISILFKNQTSISDIKFKKTKQQYLRNFLNIHLLKKKKQYEIQITNIITDLNFLYHQTAKFKTFDQANYQTRNKKRTFINIHKIIELENKLDNLSIKDRINRPDLDELINYQIFLEKGKKHNIIELEKPFSYIKFILKFLSKYIKIDFEIPYISLKLLNQKIPIELLQYHLTDYTLSKNISKLFTSRDLLSLATNFNDFDTLERAIALPLQLYHNDFAHQIEPQVADNHKPILVSDDKYDFNFNMYIDSNWDSIVVSSSVFKLNPIEKQDSIIFEYNIPLQYNDISRTYLSEYGPQLGSILHQEFLDRLSTGLNHSITLSLQDQYNFLTLSPLYNNQINFKNNSFRNPIKPTKWYGLFLDHSDFIYEDAHKDLAYIDDTKDKSEPVEVFFQLWYQDQISQTTTPLDNPAQDIYEEFWQDSSHFNYTPNLLQYYTNNFETTYTHPQYSQHYLSFFQQFSKYATHNFKIPLLFHQKNYISFTNEEFFNLVQSRKINEALIRILSTKFASDFHTFSEYSGIRIPSGTQKNNIVRPATHPFNIFNFSLYDHSTNRYILQKTTHHSPDTLYSTSFKLSTHAWLYPNINHNYIINTTFRKTLSLVQYNTTNIHQKSRTYLLPIHLKQTYQILNLNNPTNSTLVNLRNLIITDSINLNTINFWINSSTELSTRNFIPNLVFQSYFDIYQKNPINFVFSKFSFKNQPPGLPRNSEKVQYPSWGSERFKDYKLILQTLYNLDAHLISNNIKINKPSTLNHIISYLKVYLNPQHNHSFNFNLNKPQTWTFDTLSKILNQDKYKNLIKSTIGYTQNPEKSGFSSNTQYNSFNKFTQDEYWFFDKSWKYTASFLKNLTDFPKDRLAFYFILFLKSILPLLLSFCKILIFLILTISIILGFFGFFDILAVSYPLRTFMKLVNKFNFWPFIRFKTRISSNKLNSTNSKPLPNFSKYSIRKKVSFFYSMRKKRLSFWSSQYILKRKG